MKTIPSSPLSMMWLWKSALAFISLSGATVKGQDYTCDAIADNMGPCLYQRNGVCDSNLGGNPKPGCEFGDCLDCNSFCNQFNYDCNGCLNAKGCYYCPSEGTCDNSPYYVYENVINSCNDPSKFLQGGTGLQCGRHDNFFSDPLYEANSWVYKMIKVEPVWKKKNFGENIRVRVNDDGVDFLNNKEFEGRYDLAASCEKFGPLPTDLNGHGTKVAGIVSGNKDNGACAVGIAPMATLSSCNIFAGLPFSVLAEKLETFDISQNSFGIPACVKGQETRRELQSSNCPFTVPSTRSPCSVCDFSTEILSKSCEEAIIRHCSIFFEDDDEGCLDFLQVLLRGGECDYDKLPPSALDALSTGVLQGRGGKGIIYVFASGNGYAQGDDINFGGFTNSRFTISVGAVGKDGLHASYSTPGAALFVSGPGGDAEDVSKLMTAGLGGTCTDSGPGTSFACPVVSGVIALMLKANPSLTWRDVQGILASTSQRVTSDPDDSTAMINGAGVWHSNLYGFGIINADAAVAASEKWQLLPKEEMIFGESAVENIEIKDDGSTISSVISIPPVNADFVIEAVEILLDLQHSSRGDLSVVLKSPKQTASILHPGKRPENGQSLRWKLLTVRNWGEKAAGDWTLQIQDLRSGNFHSTDMLRQWRLVIYGRHEAGQKDATLPSQPPTSTPTVATSSPSMSSTTTEPTRSPSVYPATSAPTTPQTPAISPSLIATTQSPISVAPMAVSTLPPSTEAPKNKKSRSPTAAPSNKPEAVNTIAPVTASPTLLPTNKPVAPMTSSPTLLPTNKPVAPVTTSPVMTPSIMGTSAGPTIMPSPKDNASIGVPTTNSPAVEPTLRAPNTPSPAPITPTPTPITTTPNEVPSEMIPPVALPVEGTPSNKPEAVNTIAPVTGSPTLLPANKPVAPKTSSPMMTPSIMATSTGPTKMPSSKDNASTGVPTTNSTEAEPTVSAPGRPPKPVASMTASPTLLPATKPVAPKASSPMMTPSVMATSAGPTIMPSSKDNASTGVPTTNSTEVKPSLRAPDRPLKPVAPVTSSPTLLPANKPVAHKTSSPIMTPSIMATSAGPTTMPSSKDNASAGVPTTNSTGAEPTLRAQDTPSPTPSITTTPTEVPSETMPQVALPAEGTVSTTLRQLSLDLIGLEDIPSTLWGFVEATFKQHCEDYIAEIKPAYIYFETFMEMISVTVNDQAPASRRLLRSLEETSITLTYNQNLTYVPPNVTDEMTPYGLASLPFSTARARQDFARKLMMSKRPDSEGFQALVGVSGVYSPPSSSPTLSPLTSSLPSTISTKGPATEGGQRVAPLTKAPSYESDSNIIDDANLVDPSTQNQSSGIVEAGKACWAMLLIGSVVALL